MMTETQKFLFDVKGWLLIPGVLREDEIGAIKDHVCNGGDGFTGPAAQLLDHPVLVPILTELLGTRIAEYSPGDDYYPFRCENSFVNIRKGGKASADTAVPHNVGRGNVLAYQCEQGHIYSGLTRVVWELNPVKKGGGGTLFLSGSHKANFPLPAEIVTPGNAHLESYECPAGSLFIFCESLLHASADWTNYELDRVAIFNCYNSVMSQYHKLNLPPAVAEAMPAARRSLFRGVFGHDMSKPPADWANKRYADDNRAL